MKLVEIHDKSFGLYISKEKIATAIQSLASKIKTDLKEGYLYLENNGLTYDFYDVGILENYFEAHHSKTPRRDLDKLPCHSYKVIFEGGNLSTIKKHTKSKTY